MRARPFFVMVLLTPFMVLAAFRPAAGLEVPPPRMDRYGDPLPKGALTRLGTVRFSQPGLMGLVFSSDGKSIFSAGDDNQIRLWETDSGKESRILKGHKSEVLRIALSADGKWLASSSRDSELFLWEVDTGKVRRRFVGHKQPIYGLALSRNGKILASSCTAGTLRLWDTDSGKELHSLPIDQRHLVTRMAFTPDNKHLAYFHTPENGIQLVDVVDGKVSRAFKGHKNTVEDLAFSADGKTLVSCSFMDKMIRFWDVATVKEQRCLVDESQKPFILTLAPDGKTLTYVTFPDYRVHILDLATNKDLVLPEKNLLFDVRCITYSPDSKKVAVGDGRITIYDTTTGKRLNPAPENDSSIGQIAFAPNGKLLAVWRSEVELWDTTQWRTKATLRSKAGHYFTAMAYSPSGKYLTTAEGDMKQSVICHWDPDTGQRQKEFVPTRSFLLYFSYSMDGAILGGSSQSFVFVRWDPLTGKELGKINCEFPLLRSPRLSPDGKLMACTSFTHAIALWDPKTEKLIRGFGTPFIPGSGGVVFSPDGRTIVAQLGKTLEDRSNVISPDIVLWETATGQERLHITLKEGGPREVAFSPDGRYLASTNLPGTIQFWDAWTGKELGQLTGHRGWINSLAFSPDCKTLASAGADRTVLIWDVAGLLSAAKPAAKKLSGEELAKCWAELAGTDARRVYQTLATLALHPEQVEALLQEKLDPKPGISADRLNQLIADLDKENFKIREDASKELAKLGREAEGALRKALDAKPSPEVRQRVQDLVEKLNGKTGGPEQRQRHRAIEVLERLGTEESRRLLRKVTQEATDPSVAQEAQASLERIEKVGRRQP